MIKNFRNSQELETFQELCIPKHEQVLFTPKKKVSREDRYHYSLELTNSTIASTARSEKKCMPYPKRKSPDKKFRQQYHSADRLKENGFEIDIIKNEQNVNLCLQKISEGLLEQCRALTRSITLAKLGYLDKAQDQVTEINRECYINVFKTKLQSKYGITMDIEESL